MLSPSQIRLPDPPEDLENTLKIIEQKGTFAKKIAVGEFEVKMNQIEIKYNQKLDELKDAQILIEELKTQQKNTNNEITTLKKNYLDELTEKQIIQDRYEDITNKLMTILNCSSIDESFSAIQRLAAQEGKIDMLSSQLVQARAQLSASNRLLESKNQNQHDVTEIANLKSKLTSTEKVVDEYKLKNEELRKEIINQNQQLLDKQNEIVQLQSEVEKFKASAKNYEDYSKSLLDENKQIRANQEPKHIESQRRFKQIEHIAKRIEPGFLALDKTNILYDLFDSLSMLLNLTANLNMESSSVSQEITNFINLIKKSIDQIKVSTLNKNQTTKGDSSLVEEINILKQSIEEQNHIREDLENQVQECNERIEEMERDDLAPQVAHLLMKVKDLEKENNLLKNQLRKTSQPAQSSLRGRILKNTSSEL